MDELRDLRDRDPAHDADRVPAGTTCLELRGQPAGEERRLARPEDDPLDVGGAFGTSARDPSITAKRTSGYRRATAAIEGSAWRPQIVTAS